MDTLFDFPEDTPTTLQDITTAREDEFVETPSYTDFDNFLDDGFVWAGHPARPFTDYELDSIAQSDQIVFSGFHDRSQPSSFRHAMDEVRERNDDAKVYAYNILRYSLTSHTEEKAQYAISIGEDPGPVINSWTNAISRNHQDWILRDLDGERVARFDDTRLGDYPVGYFYDLSNSDVQSWFVNWARNRVEIDGFDGVALDFVVPLLNGDTTDDMWIERLGQEKAEAYDAAISIILDRVAAEVGRENLIINNLIRRYEVIDGVTVEIDEARGEHLSIHAQTSLNELFVGNHRAGLYTADDFREDFAVWDQLHAHNSGIYQKVNFYESWESQTDLSAAQINTLGFAAFLMGYQPGLDYYDFGRGYTLETDPVWDTWIMPIQSARLGDPTALREAEAPDVLSRDFENGTVLVNIGDTGYTYTVETDAYRLHNVSSETPFNFEFVSAGTQIHIEGKGALFLSDTAPTETTFAPVDDSFSAINIDAPQSFHYDALAQRDTVVLRSDFGGGGPIALREALAELRMRNADIQVYVEWITNYSLLTNTAYDVDRAIAQNREEIPELRRTWYNNLSQNSRWEDIRLEADTGNRADPLLRHVNDPVHGREVEAGYIDLSTGLAQSWGYNFIANRIEDGFDGVYASFSLPFEHISPGRLDDGRSQWDDVLSEQAQTDQHDGLTAIIARATADFGMAAVITDNLVPISTDPARNAALSDTSGLSLDREFALNPRGLRYQTIDEMRDHFDLMDIFAANDRQYLARVSYRGDADSSGYGLTLGRTADELDSYAYGAFLMAYQPGTHLYDFSKTYALSDDEDSIIQLGVTPAQHFELGAPVADRVEIATGVFMREFADGYVIANISDDAYDFTATEDLGILSLRQPIAPTDLLTGQTLTIDDHVSVFLSKLTP